jgi:hypothetical protein
VNHEVCQHGLQFCSCEKSRNRCQY